MDKENQPGTVPTENKATPDLPMRIKEEPPEDIKNYAESTMNELLSWYGYDDKINSSDTKNLNLEKYTDKDTDENGVSCDDVISEDGSIDSTETEVRIQLRKRLSNGQRSLAEQHRSLVTALSKRADQSVADDIDDSESQADDILTCAWCRKPGDKAFTLKTPTGSKSFCSEVCFTQCRRSSFKKSKICDWCKHVRHTVNYVDFQDGVTQLQFCSEKCLNQYKMSIFCKETQEHLSQIHESSEESSAERENEKEILITPELWLNGAQSQKGTERRLSLPSDSNKRDTREQLRKSFSASIEKSILKKMSESSHNKDIDNSLTSLSDRVKTESSKHRRSIRRDNERLAASPSVTEAPSTSPKQSTPAPVHTPAPAHLSAHMFHPGMAAGMAPWLHHAQMMNTLTPGKISFPGLPGLMFPPFGATAVLPEMAPAIDKPSRTPVPRTAPHIHSSVPLSSPNSERSSNSENPQNGHRNENPVVSTAPSLGSENETQTGGRRTSSLFPMDFPAMFPPQALPPGMFPQYFPGQLPVPTPSIPGIPPVTMMIPFPVLLPLPVPVPVPIPLTMDTLLKHFRTTNSDSNRKHTSSVSDNNACNNDNKDLKSPRPCELLSPASITSSGSDARYYDKADIRETRSGSRNSCPDLSLSYSNDSYLSITESQSVKRSRTPDEARSLDLSKRAKYDYDNFRCRSTDGVIDLSKDSSRKGEHSVTSNGDLSDADERSRDSNSNVTSDGLPKIHIITHRDDVPLNQHLPLPPTENPYSTRRGLILDAPSIPKKQRSPSPERRSYVRNVPRDIMEATRRRCLRTRIRTK